MKIILLMITLVSGALVRSAAGPLDAPMLETQIVFSWDTDGDGTEEVRYLGSVAPKPGIDHIYNRVRFENTI
jgi:hypothetical protein